MRGWAPAGAASWLSVTDRSAAEVPTGGRRYRGAGSALPGTGRARCDPGRAVGEVTLGEYVDPATGDPEAGGGLGDAVLLVDDVADDHVVLLTGGHLRWCASTPSTMTRLTGQRSPPKPHVSVVNDVNSDTLSSTFVPGDPDVVPLSARPPGGAEARAMCVVRLDVEPKYARKEPCVRQERGRRPHGSSRQGAARRSTRDTLELCQRCRRMTRCHRTLGPEPEGVDPWRRQCHAGRADRSRCAAIPAPPGLVP